MNKLKDVRKKDTLARTPEYRYPAGFITGGYYILKAGTVLVSIRRYETKL
jgi:hypothetical protein